MKRVTSTLVSVLTIASSTVAFGVENNLPSITATPSVVSEGETFTLMFAGTAPDGCGIAADAPVVSGDKITITVRQNRERICTQVLTPFRQPLTVFTGAERAQAGVYKVFVNRLVISESGAESTLPLAFALVPVRKLGSTDIAPEPGNWNFELGGEFATSGSGVGFNIERQGESVVVQPSFYDDKGMPQWYFSSGKQEGNALSAQLYAVTGGQPLFGAYKAPAAIDPIGHVAMEFLSPSRATVWITQPSDEGLLSPLKIMPISISRFNYGYGARADAFVGDWILASEVAAGTDTQQLNFKSGASGANTVLRFESGEFKLNCTVDLRTSRSLPSACVLLRGNLQVAVFDQVGHTRLRGKDSSGKALSLFRVEP